LENDDGPGAFADRVSGGDGDLERGLLQKSTGPEVIAHEFLDLVAQRGVRAGLIKISRALLGRLVTNKSERRLRHLVGV
jgi:hypothetical protein